VRKSDQKKPTRVNQTNPNNGVRTTASSATGDASTSATVVITTENGIMSELVESTLRIAVRRDRQFLRVGFDHVPDGDSSAVD
jgi:hypothetical protein